MTTQATPNILLILIDDLGWTDLTCYGSSFYETPHLDRLAENGLRFTDAYAACPVCSPTRASVLTGRYPARVGITNYIAGNGWGKLMGVPYFHALPKSEITIAQALAPAGYRSYHVGKWHLGGEGHAPTDFGFDVNIGGCHAGHPPSYFSPYKISAIQDGPDGEYLTDRLTDESIKLLAEHQEGAPRHGQPFFLNLWHYAVHTPIQSPPDLVEKYRQKAERLGLRPEYAIQEGERFSCLHKKNERIQRRIVQSHPAYTAMMENLDTNIGRLLQSLQDMQLDRDTLVIFTSDNGGLATSEGSPTCNAPLDEGKGWIQDGGNRVCFIAAGAGVHSTAGTCEVPVTSTDLMPTFLDLAGVSTPPDVEIDGVSLLPAFAGQDMPERSIFWHYPHYSNQGGTPSCAVRQGDYKLIETFEDNRLSLFNLRDDIGEQQDLAETHPDRLHDMHRQLVDWRQRIEAKIPEVNEHYEDMLHGRRPCPDSMGRIPGDDH